MPRRSPRIAGKEQATTTASARAPSSNSNGNNSSRRRKDVNHPAREQTPPGPPSHQLDGRDASSIGPKHDDTAGFNMRAPFSSRNQWILFAIASGACAAFNGVFAKLTTTELTSSFAKSIAGSIGVAEGVTEVVIRAAFFGLNLVFNGVMWTLFTQALAKGHSTTQVSIMNTSTNFMLTALLGLAIFAESLPPLWWLGAALLVAGNVIIGRKDEGAASESGAEPAAAAAAAAAEDGASVREDLVLQEQAPLIPREEKNDEDEDVLDLNIDDVEGHNHLGPAR